eukprot:5152084-Prymnesium_polylepis.1
MLFNSTSHQVLTNRTKRPSFSAARLARRITHTAVRARVSPHARVSPGHDPRPSALLRPLHIATRRPRTQHSTAPLASHTAAS